MKEQKSKKVDNIPEPEKLNKSEKENRPNKPNRKEVRGTFLNNVIGTVLIFIAIISIYTYTEGDKAKVQKISISELVTDINAGKVESISVTDDDLSVIYTDKVEKESKKEVQSSLTETLSNLGVEKEKIAAVKIDNKIDSGVSYWLLNILPFLFPVLLFFFMIWFLTRQARGAGVQAMSFGQSRARLTTPDDSKVQITFKDVAGAKEAKQELSEIVDFLKNPKKFLDIGARIPKGILLMGAPGTGKTLLARAVAGEAGVAFFSMSGSEFVEMFVGVGASRVRDLFKQAKLASPAIIFIDEIDAVGRSRGAGMGGGNDEREQTLNQILVEMDGFEPNEKVIVMAATNRPDVLDTALLRPGRFDRRVTIDLPDRADRLAILEVHVKNKPLAEDINLEVVAERTPGFSGADLYSLMNEGAILAARENRTKIGQYDLIRSIEKVMIGPERQSHLLSKKEKELTAYHEAGHALLASVLVHADPVHKVSIISRGRAAGYTMKLPLEERRTQSKNEFLDDIVVSLGGYVVEKNIFGDLTTGSSNDLQVSTALARDMVTKYGMSDKIGPIALEASSGRAMFGQGVGDKEYSEAVGTTIDSEVSKIMNEAYDRAFAIITEKRVVLDAIAKALVSAETLEQKEYEQILVAHGIELKKKEVIVEEAVTITE
ncbi:ATP-dependent zinc metalloprotease FtsH [Candidatus Woesebacteria bacterium]|nr:ATP-dependent zinc metalloprotease FtsH [Candidatus Woesebacteria bacterium]